MANILHLLFILMLFTNLFMLTNSILSTNVRNSTNPKRLVFKLVHIFSFNSSNSYFDVSFSDYLDRNTNYFSETRTNIQTRLRLNDQISYGLFLVKFAIGQPPIQQYAYMDTGSDLSWVHCNLRKYSEKYNPRMSSTYEEITCFDYICLKRFDMRCDDLQKCRYSKRYKGGAESSGVVAYEQFTFGTNEEGIISIPNVIFGCSTNYEGKLFGPKRTDGIFALGVQYSSTTPSMLDSLGVKKFSYCIGHITEPYYQYNQLAFGDAADNDGDRTPLQIFGEHYYLTVTGISLGGRMLDIDSSVFSFKEGEGDTGVVIDTGAIATFLVKPAYDVVYKKMKDLLDSFLLPRYYSNSSDLCYQGRINEDLQSFPVLRIHLTGGAEFALDSASLFLQTIHFFCMQIHLGNGPSIIGLMAQQNYNVAYDLEKQMLSLEIIDCSLFL